MQLLQGEKEVFHLKKGCFYLHLCPVFVCLPLGWDLSTQEGGLKSWPHVLFLPGLVWQMAGPHPWQLVRGVEGQ